MASACVNNIGVSPENFLDCPPYGWLSPRISFSRDDDSSSSKLAGPLSSPVEHALEEKADSEPFSGGDFEFRLHDPVTMLPADELFSDGKLVPLQLSSVKPSVNERTSLEIRSPEWAKSRRRTEMEISSTDPYLFSPKAPRCSSRWKDLLGLKKKLYQNNTTNSKTEMNHKTTSSSSFSSNSKSLKHFLHRSSKSSSSSSSSDASLSLPLLKDTDCESVSMSSRLSLSSSSSGHEHEDLPRLSLDSDKPNPNPICIHRNPNQTRMRLVKARPVTSSESNNNSNSNTNQARVGRSPIRRATTSNGGGGGGGGEQHSRGVSVDSPRMNSSGKIVFQSLERSSSSPSSFNNGGGGNGPRFKQHGRGMERSYSYSANVRVTPVLNVPVCSLRGSSKSVSVFGFSQLFSSTTTGGGTNRPQHSHNNSTRNRTKGG